jgi:hypothetical protein
MDSPQETGLRINNLALTETVYLFCDWALNVYKFAAPQPGLLNFRMIFSDMAPDGKPFNLSPYAVNTYGFRFNDDSRPSPIPYGIQIETNEDFAKADPGTVAYALLKDFYIWFGFEANRVPYVNREKEPRIDPGLIVSSAKHPGL